MLKNSLQKNSQIDILSTSKHTLNSTGSIFSKEVKKTDENKVQVNLTTNAINSEKIQMSAEDFSKFVNIYQIMDNSKKWALTTGKIVEDELYKFDMRYNRSLINEKVFTKSELEKIHMHKQKLLLDMPQDLLLYLNRVFENIEGVEVERKIMGRRGDLIIHRNSMEFGYGKARNLFKCNNRTKILHDRGLKIPKMMKDQFNDLCTHVKSREKIVRNLMTIGFIHSGLSVLLFTLDSPAGYICRISHSKKLTVLLTVDEFSTRALPTIILT
ncbi:4602_t:CDS:2 [Funneliformis mosseae]|uniref:4602_t:CDS:1 n=1 Tax=Funneliformis mosseae TaxID=27381 RepID=A0A9N8V1U2_FUNMO|nr:4602_t:CDS:2 [Funneliformis mosseae]